MSEENNEKKKQEKFDITIDTAQTNAIIRENERLKIEMEDIKEKLALVAEKQLEAKMKEYGIPIDRKAEFMANPESLKDYAPRKAPSGSAPINPDYNPSGNIDLYKRKFNSEKEMVDAILEDMHGTDPQKAEIAKSYYEALLTNWVRTKKHKQGLDDFFDPNDPRSLPPMTRTPEGFVTPQDKSEGDIGKLQKKWRNERKRKSEEGAK